MSDYFAIRVIDDRYQVGITTDGRDWYPIPRAAFPTPRQAITYASMREAQVSPLRGSVEDPSPVPPVAGPQPSPSPDSK